MCNFYAYVGAQRVARKREGERERLWQLAWEAKCCRAWLPKLHVRHIDVFVYVNRKCCAAGAV